MFVRGFWCSGLLFFYLSEIGVRHGTRRPSVCDEGWGHSEQPRLLGTLLPFAAGARVPRFQTWHPLRLVRRSRVRTFFCAVLSVGKNKLTLVLAFAFALATISFCLLHERLSLCFCSDTNTALSIGSKRTVS